MILSKDLRGILSSERRQHNRATLVFDNILKLIWCKPNVLILLGWLAMFIAGYFLTYQLFFTSMPIDRLGDSSGGSQVDFVYPGVAHFKGTKLTKFEKLVTQYIAPTVAEVGAKYVEIYVHIPKPFPEENGANILGNLVIEQSTLGSKKKTYTVPLTSLQHQRFMVPWEPVPKQVNKIEIYVNNASEAKNVYYVVATNVVADLWGWILTFLVLSLMLLIMGWWRQAKVFAVERVQIFVITTMALFLTPLCFMYLFHSGFFISNSLLENDQYGSVIGFHRQLAHLLTHGYLSENSYRSAAQVYVPSLVLIVEQTSIALSRPFAEIYPTYRYLMFALTAASFVVLVSVMRSVFGTKISMIFFFLVAIFFPFVVDLYAHDVDAYFIFLFPLFVAALIKIIYSKGNDYWSYFALFVIFIMMATVKTTPAFLVMVAPLVLSMSYHSRGFFLLPKGIISSSAALALLLVAFGGFYALGAKFGNAFKHPNANVGIMGEPFQDTVLWHMLWAASGTYDVDSAHSFARDGTLRNKRVAEITGLDNVSYLRQSQAATDKVYKPQLMNAINERPGFFYATAILRAYSDGIKLFRYTLGFREENFRRFLDGIYTDEELREIRFGEGWKISPLVQLAKFTQNDISRFIDWILYGLGIVGLFIIRSRPLLMFMLLVCLAEVSFSILIHSLNRYFMFCSIAPLFGLSLFISRFLDVIFKRQF